MNHIKGLTLTIIIAVVATLLGGWFPIIGNAIFSITIGIVIGNLVKLPQSFEPGIKLSSKKILHYSIIVLGFTLSFQSIGHVGIKSLPIIIVTLGAAFIIVYLLMKLLHIDEHLSILIGVGTSICGGSAIAATSPVIKAKRAKWRLRFRQFSYLISSLSLSFHLWDISYI